MTDFDYIHIGLIGIKSYEEFWDALDSVMVTNSFSQELNDVSVLRLLLKNNIEFKIKVFDDWVDIGNANSLVVAKKKLGTNLDVLEKPQESVSFIKDFVVKFFSDPKIVAGRVKRAEFLEPTIPSLVGSSKHFFTYSFHKGELMSNANNSKLILSLLDWATINLWEKTPGSMPEEFDSVVDYFYSTKSNLRLAEFTESRSIKDEKNKINGIEVPSATQLIMDSKKSLTSEIKVGRFHGDFILDNILISKEGFKLIDWRQDFGGSIEYADIYYDLAKLNHSLHINHSLVLEGHYFVSTQNNEVECGILRKDIHIEMQEHLKFFIESKNLSWKKVQVLTGLIWINMSPLHHNPFDKFLYYYGRYHLWKALDA